MDSVQKKKKGESTLLLLRPSFFLPRSSPPQAGNCSKCDKEKELGDKEGFPCQRHGLACLSLACLNILPPICLKAKIDPCDGKVQQEQN